MRIGTSHGTYAYAGEMEANYARMRAHGYTAADHNLCDTNEPWYSDMAELDRYCDRVRKAAEADAQYAALAQQLSEKKTRIQSRRGRKKPRRKSAGGQSTGGVNQSTHTKRGGERA